MLQYVIRIQVIELARRRDILIRGNLVTIKGNYVTLTDAGKETARKLNKVIGA
jgi:Mn-dependent DtxR family transcriptional regulator